MTENAGRTIDLEMEPSKDTVRVKGAGGVTSNTYVNWTSFFVNQKDYSCRDGAPCQFATGLRGVQNIQYPPVAPQTTTRYHSFEYASGPGWGELKKQTLPSGSTVEYTYVPAATFNMTVPVPEGAVNPVTDKAMKYLEENPSPPGGSSQNQRTETWAWNYPSATQTIETAPDGGTTTYTFAYSAQSGGFPATPKLITGIAYPNGDIVYRIWMSNTPFPRANAIGGTVDNPFTWDEYRRLAAASGPAKRARTCRSIDKNGNTLRVTQYAFTDGSLPPGVPPTPFPPIGTCPAVAGTDLQTTVNTFARPTAVAATTTEQANGYWNVAPNVAPLRFTLNAIATATVTGAGGNGRQTQFDYDDGGGRANVTAQRNCNSAGANCLGTSASFDSFGNLTSRTNEVGTVTQFEYEIPSYFQNPALYPKRKIEAYGSASPRTYEYTYDKFIGATLTELDVQNSISQTMTYDLIGRLVTRIERGGTAGQAGYLERRTSFTRNDSLRTETELTDKVAYTDGLLINVTRTDMHGNIRLSQSSPDIGIVSDADPSSGIRRDSRVYTVPGSARYSLVSSPVQSWTDTMMGWTRTRFDRMGRPVERNHFDGSALPLPFDNGAGATSPITGTATMAYSANEVTVTDEANVATKEVRDALGRITSVVQAGNTTGYLYDCLSNLIQVTQSGGGFTQVRVFEYDHHSRLLKAWMPETSPDNPATPNSGAASNKPTIYTYYADGNLHTRTDGRSVVTTHTYDVHGRLKTTSYSDSTTPSITLDYDAGGRLVTATAAGVSSTAFVYDKLGRFERSTQTTFGVPYAFGTSSASPGYRWNLADGLTELRLPSGRLITYALSGANRQQSATANSVVYSQVTGFAPDGRVRTSTLGSGATESVSFNSLGQWTGVTVQKGVSSLLGISNEYEATANNGNLKSQTLQPLGMKQSFGYDTRNRLGSASEAPAGGGGSVWSQTFGYDDFGNRWVGAQSGPLPSGGPRPNGPSWYHQPITGGTGVNNRVVGEAYDMAGNQTSLGALTAEYDGESRVRRLLSNGLAVASFDYDALGQRVRAIRDNRTVVMVYDALGRMAAEYEPGVSGALQPQYVTQDHLGSVRMVTNATGTVLRRADFLPYGEEIPVGVGGRTLLGYGQGGLRQRFTGKEREVESLTPVDYFGARYLWGGLGRFTSPDAPLVDQSPEDPQSWNLFAYVRNNPLRYNDPDGRTCQTATEGYKYDDLDGQGCGDVDIGNITKKPDLTVKSYRSGGEAAFDRHGQYISGSFRPPAPEETALQDQSYQWTMFAMSPGMSMLSAIFPSDGGAATTAMAMIPRVGGGKTGRKVNEKAFEVAQQSVEMLKRVLKRLEGTPNKSPATKEAIEIVKGRLNKAAEGRKKSEPHGVGDE